MRHRANHLFSGPPAHAVEEHVQTTAMSQLKAHNEEVILRRPTEDLVTELLAKHSLRFPELRETDTWVEESEVVTEVPVRGYDFENDRHGGTRTFTSHIVSFHVPFDGDGSLFNVQPSRRSLPGPAAELNGQELIIQIATDQKSDAQVRHEFGSLIESIKQHLSTLANDLRHTTSQIEAPARIYVEERKAQLLKHKNLVAYLGFPMKRRADVPRTYAAPDVRRKLTPVKPQIVAAFKPEPALAEAEYQHILNVMDNMTQVMERSPQTFEKMREEDMSWAIRTTMTVKSS